MKEIAIYWGCFIPTKQYASELSTRKVLEVLNYRIIELPQMTCCGHPLRGAFTNIWLYLALRNIALAEDHGLNLLVMCNGCYLSFREALYLLKERPRAIQDVIEFIDSEGLKIRGRTKVIHPIEFFHDIVGIDVLKKFSRDIDLRVAAHYGCHAIRPSKFGGFDDSRDPSKFEHIIKAIGFKVKHDYPGRLLCCGATLMAINPELGLKLTARKLSKANEAGVELMTTTCPYCMEMLDARQQSALKYMKEPKPIPTMYYQQILGLLMGFNTKDLGLNLNQSPIDEVINRILRR